jgi:hypothetical protein
VRPLFVVNVVGAALLQQQFLAPSRPHVERTA